MAPRSPDLNQLEFFLWDYIKSKVNLNKPENIEDPKERMRQEVWKMTCSKSLLWTETETSWVSFGFNNKIICNDFVSSDKFLIN